MMCATYFSVNTCDYISLPAPILESSKLLTANKTLELIHAGKWKCSTSPRNWKP